MKILPNPVKEAGNRAKHRLDFSLVGEILSGPVLEWPDDRPLGYQHEARVRVLAHLGLRVFMLVYEPVEIEDGELAIRPISLRSATPRETRDYWRHCG